MALNSINEIKKNLLTLEPHELTALCLRMAKYKKENKELLSYLLFESQNETLYIEKTCNEINNLFEEIVISNSYKYTKQIRKILKFANKQIKYSGLTTTQIEILIHFCEILKPKVLRFKITALENIYSQQIKKINTALTKLHEDIQYDFNRKIDELML